VRPTQDAVREALFSMLGTRIPGCAFLDLFAGSGAVGIEAWSRGAESVTWVESHRSVARILGENVATLCNGAGQVVNDDVFHWLMRPGDGPAFDVVYADPPYGDKDVDDRIDEVMRLLAESGRMAADALFIAEQRAGRPMPKAAGWNRLKDRRYGHTRLALFTTTRP
jgi:16S rRNA (guanine966-N2)-methyltransferase